MPIGDLLFTCHHLTGVYTDADMLSRPVLYRLENEFGVFSVEELNYEGREARVLFSSPLHAAQSGIPLDNDPHLLFDYNQRFLELALELNPSKILVLGGGALTLPSALALRNPRAKITVVEINSDLIKLAPAYFNYTPSPRIRVMVADAAKFIQQTRSTYDLIIVDIYNNLTIPPSFCGIAFANQLSRVLVTNGMVATNCITGLSGESGVLKQIVMAYQTAIGPVRVFSVDLKHPYRISQNLIIISRKGPFVPRALLKGSVEIDNL